MSSAPRLRSSTPIRPAPLTDDAALALAERRDTAALMAEAAALRDAAFGAVMTYSRKVFIPLTHLCRDSCHYCTFATPPRRGEPAYMSPEEVLAVARAGAAAGCTEALFTLGDKPELRYPAARAALAALGHATTLDYLRAVAKLVIDETGLLPHLNPGVMTRDDMAKLRPVAASMGLMLETASPRLSERGGVHFGSPDKDPAVRLATIEAAGALDIPFTTGLLIGIGETRRERIEAMLALRARDRGHIQEVIIQPFRAKPGTRMAAEPGRRGRRSPVDARGRAPRVRGEDEHSDAAQSRAAAHRRSDQGRHRRLGRHLAGDAGLRQSGSAVAASSMPWPTSLRGTGACWCRGSRSIRSMSATRRDGSTARCTRPWCARATRRDWRAPTTGRRGRLTCHRRRCRSPPIGSAGPSLDRILAKAESASPLAPAEIEMLFAARGADYDHVCATADRLRARAVGDTVTYVVNRNINYTNVCSYRCAFCAFSKGKSADHLRGPAYDLDHDEIARRVTEAWARGATEVCLQGGIHPDYTGDTYLAILRTVKAAVPAMHVHAFSPLEVRHGAATLGIPVRQFLERLRDAGLGSLPGTAAEILDDEVRAVICPDKLTHRRMARCHRDGAPRRSFDHRDHHVRPCGRARRIGRGISWRCATCRCAPAASPSSCRCRSCTWRRRSITRARRAAGRRSARRC